MGNSTGVLRRSIRCEPPSHFLFKVDSFSKLSSNSVKRYESSEFDAGDHRWKLALYPNGSMIKGVGHISLYLVSADKNCRDLNKEISVVFTLFIYDHIRDKYLSVQAPLTRFHAMRSESGFHKFLPLRMLTDITMGYLRNDTCIFGAEVFVVQLQKTNQGQHLSMIPTKQVSIVEYRWETGNFSGLMDTHHYSPIFKSGGYDWRLVLSPYGDYRAKGKSLSLYLQLANILADTTQVVVKYKLRVVNQINRKKKERVSTSCYRASQPAVFWGWPDFLPLSDLNKVGYLVKDTIVFEAEVKVLGCEKKWNIAPPPASTHS